MLVTLGIKGKDIFELCAKNKDKYATKALSQLRDKDRKTMIETLEKLASIDD